MASQVSVSVRKVGFSCSGTPEHLDKPRGSRIAHQDAGRILNYRERHVVRPERKGRCEDGAGVMRTQRQSEPHGCCNLGQEENEMLERTSWGVGTG